jgi:hypothetical protein
MLCRDGSVSHVSLWSPIFNIRVMGQRLRSKPGETCSLYCRTSAGGGAKSLAAVKALPSDRVAP